MSKDRRTILRFAAVGFGVAAVLVIWQVLAVGTALSNFLSAVFVIFCPPSLLTIPLIDVKTGTAGFSVVGVVIGLANGAFYALIGAAYVGLRKKREGGVAS